MRGTVRGQADDGWCRQHDRPFAVCAAHGYEHDQGPSALARNMQRKAGRGPTERVERIREQLSSRPHLAGECLDERVELVLEVERLTALLERERAAHAEELATRLYCCTPDPNAEP